MKYRDRIKNEFAKNNRITLYRISGIQNIDAFFNCKFWKSQIKKVVIHKPKRKQLTTWQKNHQPKEEKPFVPLNYSWEYIKKKRAENKKESEFKKKPERFTIKFKSPSRYK